jgi:uncharacterized protein with HEPN domain
VRVTPDDWHDPLSDGFQKQYEQLDWVQIAAVRSIATRRYWQLDMRQIWQAAEEDIPLLEALVHELTGK